MKIKKVRKSVLFLTLSMALFLPSFSISAFADAHDDALAEMELQMRSQGDNVFLYPESGYQNSTAYNTSGNILQFSGNGTMGGTNNTFDNFDVTVDGDFSVSSGASVSSLTVNQTLGNTQEIATIIGRLQDADNLLAGILYAVVAPIQSTSDSYTVQTSYGSMTIPLLPITLAHYTTTNGVLTQSTSQWYCGLGTAVLQYSECIIYNIATIMEHLSYHFNSLRSDILSASASIVSAIQDAQTYNYWNLTPSQDGETFSKTVVSQSGTFHSILLNRCEYIADVLAFNSGRMYEWFYPLDNVDPEYWRYYNTDKKTSENIGLAGLMYNISWYLGNLYVLQSASAALDGMETAVENVTTTFENIETQEQAVISSVSSHIEQFNPNISDINALRALPWMSNYLQSIYVALGTYGTVITIGLLLGVCLKIIRY